MAYQLFFKRREIKFLISLEQALELKEIMKKTMTKDHYALTTICNIYYDTSDYLLIRRSLEKPIYKEKVRFRSYGIAKDDSLIFCELKKKYESIVYKRRFQLTEKAFSLSANIVDNFPDNQTGQEIAFCFKRYPNLQPKVFLSYDREAFYANDDPNLRITFDQNILWRDYDLSLAKGIYGRAILNHNQILLEVKTNNAIPLWLTNFLSSHKIYKTSFSKYGTAYQTLLCEKKKGEIESA